MTEQVDVVVVGAGIAGCVAATLYGRRGLHVLLLEAHHDAATFKRACTHTIQPSALPTMRRLGLDERIEAAGGRRNGFDFWTPYGWVHEEDQQGMCPPYGYNVRRSVLDPLMRTMASETPGVALMVGAKVGGLVRDDAGRVSGVTLKDPDGREREVRARLVVGADGRHSVVAEQARVRSWTVGHGRFCYFAHYTGVELETTASSQIWMDGPGAAYVFGNDAGRTIAFVARPKRELDEFRRDIEGNVLAAFKNLPRAPELACAERVSDFVGVINYPSVTRRAGAPGVALIGDAAMVADYVWGVGCGWAMQTAEWLVDATAGPLLGGADAGDVDGAVGRYARQHWTRLLPHQLLIADFARGRSFNPVERLMYAASVADPWLARRGAAVMTRSASPATMASPLVVSRATAVVGRRAGDALWRRVRP